MFPLLREWTLEVINPESCGNHAVAGTANGPPNEWPVSVRGLGAAGLGETFRVMGARGWHNRAEGHDVGARRTDQSCEAQGSSWESGSVAALALAVLAAAMLACGTTDVYLDRSTDDGDAAAGYESPSGGRTGSGGASASAVGGGSSDTAGETGAAGEGGSAGSVEGGAGAGGEGGAATGIGGLTGVAPDCAERSTTDALHPLREGAWWHHWTYEASENWARTDKVNYVCEEQPMPRVPGERAFPLVSVKVGRNRRIRWQSLRHCPDNLPGYDIRRHYDELFDGEGNLLSVVHYCPYRLRTVDCLAQADQLPYYERYTEASVAADSESDGDWSACGAVQINPDSCEPEGVVPDGCNVVVCPGDESCVFTDEDHPGEVFQDWDVVGTEAWHEVPAGTFFDLEIHDNRDWEGEPAQFYWARGVGKVYENSVGIEEEELVAYCIPDGSHPPAPPPDPDLPTHCPVPGQ